MPADETLSSAFLRNHPLEAARVLEEQSGASVGRFLSRCDAGAAATVLGVMSPGLAASHLARMTPAAGGDILSRLPPRHAVALLRRLGADECGRILEAAPEDAAERARRMLGFPEGAIGEWLAADVFTLPVDITVGESLRRVRKARGSDRPEIHVLDREMRLAGLVTVVALVRAPRDEPLESIMNRKVLRVPARAAQSLLLEGSQWQGHPCIAVVDDDGVFLGVVDHDTVAREFTRLATGPRPGDTLDTALALGRLFWLGMSGVMDGIARGALERDADER